jgi:hypothetical protein
MTRWYLKTTDTNDTKSIYEPAAYALSQMPLLNQQYGVQGYFFIYPNEIWGTMLLADEQSGIPAATKAWQPVLDKMATFKGVQKPIYIHTNFPNFKSWFEALFGSLDPVPNKRRDVQDEFARHFRRHASELEEAYPRGIIPMDSRLLSQAHLSNPNLAQALHDSMPQMDSGMLRGHLTAGGRVNNPIFDAISPENAVNPAWRKAYIHLIGTGGGIPDLSSIKKISPDAGCYANECMYTEKNFKETMYGAPYTRLESIKNKYDPNGMSICSSPAISRMLILSKVFSGRRQASVPTNSQRTRQDVFALSVRAEFLIWSSKMENHPFPITETWVHIQLKN